jgi:lipopolysaccharide export system permease protein
MLGYVTLSLPSHVYVLLPAAGLIGTLFALARMSENSEITVMRASGLSLTQLALHVAGAGVVLALAVVIVGEFVTRIPRRRRRRCGSRRRGPSSRGNFPAPGSG